MIACRVASGRFVMRAHDLPGDGAPLVFLHGLGCASSCDYPTVAASAALRGRRALLVDLLGSGFSDQPEDFPYTIESLAKVVAELLDSLGHATYFLFGHSMGGAIAIAAAALLRDRAAGLVLSEPNLDAGGGTFSRSIAKMSEEEYARFGHREIIAAASDEGNSIWCASMARTLARAVHREARSLVEGAMPSWRETLYSLDLPRAVIFGARSLPDPDVERHGERGIKVLAVANAGHSMAWENPAGLAQAIASGCWPDQQW